MRPTSALRGSQRPGRRAVVRATGAGALLLLASAAGGCLGGEERDRQPTQDAAAFAPRLRVEQRPSLPGRGTTLTIDVTQQPGERALRMAEIAIPNGYRIDPPESGSIGVLAAELDMGTVDTVLTGHLAHASKGGACGGEAATRLSALLGPGGAETRQARLTVSLSNTGGSMRMTICPPTRDALPHEAAIRRLTIRLDRGLTPPNVGDAVWRGVFTPEGGDATESRAVVPAPSFLTLESDAGSSLPPGSELRLRGYLFQREAQPRRKVRILAGPAPDSLVLAGRVRTRANGSYTFTLRAPQRAGTLYVAARALSVERPCEGASAAPAGCTTSTVSGISSDPLRLAIGS